MHIIKLLTALSLLFSTITTAYAANPQVEIKTNFGTIVLELYPDKAPKTVGNFLSYVKDGYYTGTVFHRVIPGFMIQGGGFDKTLRQKPARQPVENEAANGLRNEIGTVAMARTSDPHSASAQFFINVANNAFLNHTAPTPQGYGYTVFGKVVKGMEIVNKIADTPTGPAGPFPSDVPKVTVVIEEVRLIAAEPSAAASTPTK
ncbi:peptidyl-prolyl cis-trans isomerase A (cyclophilin A)/peptidyl-prolyl cis-trans isomerase B (cyclophilin B) [Nitrosospira sp. Nsp5]|uniref:Peptidyl-prolyl cis-trans isomerase n=1 Tax=Nitrosospira multiformis TaxID=1231 RepID=A0ABY0TC41_9PROT|nr:MULTISPECIES: peptidylprolyl isomerase [Nitrosospira]PTR06365.1 peptidyl-prolyl cis-trans isomerase A (cyclophilin A)/peptidyl-prolyl cis-trans isomerase B (cyclophilin B) [Nitrosospira sp. Nsp5]SDQ59644.1 peptidyl-prolyl cis-trans isomerase A (cyclophilin A)/peptidyl-prolyl cis-trans isomerase B (cyclophilin B) [Nitrosospira multiformis]